MQNMVPLNLRLPGAQPAAELSSVLADPEDVMEVSKLQYFGKGFNAQGDGCELFPHIQSWIPTLVILREVVPLYIPVNGLDLYRLY